MIQRSQQDRHVNCQLPPVHSQNREKGIALLERRESWADVWVWRGLETTLNVCTLCEV